MAKGVSGALTRLAKISAVAPLRTGSGLTQQSARSRASIDEDEEAFYLPDDLDDLSARQYVRRRIEPKPERPVAAVAVPPVTPAAPTPTPVAAPAAAAPAPPVIASPVAPVAPAPVTVQASVAAAAPPVAGARVAAAAPPHADSGRPRAPNESRRSSPRHARHDYRDDYREERRVESSRFEVEERVEPESVARAGGRVAERIRRIKTALAAKVGREPDAALAHRGLGLDRADDRAAARDTLLENDDEPGHGLRGSWRAKQLARARRRLGMTQTEFARCFGLLADDVIRWEAGAVPGRTERVLLTLIMHDPEEMARLVDEALALG